MGMFTWPPDGGHKAIIDTDADTFKAASLCLKTNPSTDTQI